jgi:hypothetical protein
MSTAPMPIEAITAIARSSNRTELSAAIDGTSRALITSSGDVGCLASGKSLETCLPGRWQWISAACRDQA